LLSSAKNVTCQPHVNSTKSLPITLIVPTTQIKNFGTNSSCRNANWQPIARLVLVVCIILVVLPVRRILPAENTSRHDNSIVQILESLILIIYKNILPKLSSANALPNMTYKNALPKLSCANTLFNIISWLLDYYRRIVLWPISWQVPLEGHAIVMLIFGETLYLGIIIYLARLFLFFFVFSVFFAAIIRRLQGFGLLLLWLIENKLIISASASISVSIISYRSY
jgi:hypothetical protein